MKWNLLFLFLIIAFIEASPASKLEEANAYYLAGENATSFQDQKNSFNQALILYRQIEQEGTASSSLNQAIANIYFQLGEYPWSILYNERARLLDPRNQQIASHLALARKKLGLDPAVHPSWLEILSLQPFISLPGLIKGFFWIFLGSLGFASLAIWLNKLLFKVLAYAGFGIALALFINIGLSYYLAPIQGILVNSTGLYRAPSFNEPQLTDQPLLAGSKIRVVQVEKEGYWLKVLLPDGQVGYISAMAIRLIPP